MRFGRGIYGESGAGYDFGPKRAGNRNYSRILEARDMKELNRREFVAAAATAAACLCVLGNAGNVEADAPTTAPSAPATPFDAGPKSDYSKDGITDKWSKTKNRLVITRHEGKIFASTSACTHKGCAVECTPDKSSLFCHCHGATYDIDGKVTKGPAKKPLMRYGISLDANDHVIVDKSKTYAMAKWADEGSFIKVES
jgi:cytochrome b6-f complex iron-sulfur subunit